MAAYAVGHKAPDTDSIVAAIALADLKSKTGVETVAAMQGDAPPSTMFVLEKFGVKVPEIMTDATGKKLFLVDTTELTQAPDNMSAGELLGVVDHHKLGDVTTPAPLEMWVWPVGCTNTVLKAMYDFYGVEIPKNLAGAMMCAILDDTVMFKSPTCTEKDKDAVAALAKIAGVADPMAIGIEMFKVKSSVAGTPVKDLLFRDFKDFNMGGKKVGIGQLEAVDLSVFDPVKADLLAALKAVKADGRHSAFLLLTDIMKEGSEMLIVSDDPSVITKAFGVEVKGDSVWIPGCLSRKKQVVPPFEKAFA